MRSIISDMTVYHLWLLHSKRHRISKHYTFNLKSWQTLSTSNNVKYWTAQQHFVWCRKTEINIFWCFLLIYFDIFLLRHNSIRNMIKKNWKLCFRIVRFVFHEWIDSLWWKPWDYTMPKYTNSIQRLPQILITIK